MFGVARRARNSRTSPTDTTPHRAQRIRRMFDWFFRPQFAGSSGNQGDKPRGSLGQIHMT
jgi:hypothetical protein